MSATQNTGNLNNMTDAEYLVWLQEGSIELGLRPLATLEEYNTQKYNTNVEIPTDTAVRTRFAKPGQRAGRGVVRVISDAQLKYMTFLLNTRNYRKLMDEKWFRNLGVSSHAELLKKVETISLQGARTLISNLLTCPVRAHIIEAEAEQIGEDMITERQLPYLTSLLADREHTFNVVPEDLTKSEARNLIDQLNRCPRKVTPAPTKEDVKAIAGLYELDGDIYRMRKARGKTHFYAELLTDIETSAFEYASGMARKVPAQGRKLSLEECEALSLKLGACVMGCGRELTATVNGVGPAARFIGPVCAKNMGF